MDEPKSPSLAQRLRYEVGLKKSHAYMLAQRKRHPSMPLALKIESKIGVRLGPIENATPEQIEVLRQMHGEAA